MNSLKKNLNLNLIKIYGFSSKQLDPTTYVIYVLMELAITDWEKEIINMQKSRTYYTEKKLVEEKNRTRISNFNRFEFS